MCQLITSWRHRSINVNIGYISPTDDADIRDALSRRSPIERVDELSRLVFDLIKRANNIERQAGKQEDLYYRVHGQVSVVEDSVRSLNKWRRQMEAQQAALSPFIRFSTSTWAYEGWQAMVYLNTYLDSL